MQQYLHARKYNCDMKVETTRHETFINLANIEDKKSYWAYFEFENKEFPFLDIKGEFFSFLQK